MKGAKKNLFFGIFGVICVLILSQFLYTRWDLTEDGRYSFSDTTKNILDSIQKPVTIDVYLEGDLTGNFRILRNEIQFFLNELKRNNPNIYYNFYNPIEDGIIIDSLYANGVSDISVPTEDKILRVFPFATISYDGQTKPVSLLSNKKIPIDERALVSIDNIENNFMRELYRMIVQKRKEIGLIVHHDELPPNYLEGFLRLASQDYNITAYSRPLIDSANRELNYQDIDALKQFDALVIAKPILPFSDKDKEVLDQYIMNGGKTLWMVENVDAEMDSLFRSDRILAFPRQLELTDLFFAYGLRINPAVVKDLQSGLVTLAIGEMGENTVYEPFPWPYFPVSISPQNHAINRKISNPIKFEFANPIEILERDSIQPTVLLNTSPNVQLQKSLSFIDFSEIDKTIPENYPEQPGVYPLAVLLEGNFHSAYENRIESKEIPNFKSQIKDNKMIVIGDGDFAKNHVFRGQPLALGADKYTLRPDIKTAPSAIYDNGTFIMNCLDYLTEQDGVLQLNNRERTVHILDRNKVAEEKSKWQWINLLIPVTLIWFLGGLLIWKRKRKYS